MIVKSLGGAELGGEFGGTAVGCGHRVRDDSTKASAVKDLQRGRGRTALRSYLLAQGGERILRVTGHVRGAERRFQCQAVCNIGGQPAFMRRRLERFHE